MPKVTGQQLEKIAFHLFCAAGSPEEHSRIVAAHLADNNLTGHDPAVFLRRSGGAEKMKSDIFQLLTRCLGHAPSSLLVSFWAILGFAERIAR